MSGLILNQVRFRLLALSWYSGNLYKFERAIPTPAARPDLTNISCSLPIVEFQGAERALISGLMNKFLRPRILLGKCNSVKPPVASSLHSILSTRNRR